VIEPVADPSLAERLLEKINQVNQDTGLDALLLTSLWSLLPQDVASSIVVVGWILALLYYLQDRLPTSTTTVNGE